MDSLVFYMTGTLMLVAVLTGYCPNIVKSETFPSFRGLECTCGIHCTYGIQECELIRCACPYKKGDYAKDINCTDEMVCPATCCNLLPVPLQNFSAAHFIHSEKYQSYNGNESFRTLLVFTSLPLGTEVKLVSTILFQQTTDHQGNVVPKNMLVTEAEYVDPTKDDFLKGEDNIPDMFLSKLNSLKASKEFSEPLQCNVRLNTSCDKEFCSCLIYHDENPIPMVTSFRNLSENDIVYEIGNNFLSLETSSDLQHGTISSIDINIESPGPLGGWAPAFNDDKPWVQFNDIKKDVCGLVIQGVEWSSSRRLDRFSLVTGSGTISSVDGKKEFLSGVVLYSKSVHLLSTPVAAHNYLKINVIQPENPLNIGFRASLVMCGSSLDLTSCHKDSIVEKTQTKVEEIFNSSQTSEENPREDPVAWVSGFFSQLQDFFDNNFDKHLFAGSRRQSFTYGDNVGLDVSFGGLKDFQRKGYTFSSALLKNDVFNVAPITVHVPPDGFAHQLDDDNDTEVVMVTAVVNHNDSMVHKDVNDEERIRYMIISPIVTIRIFINGSKCEQLINNIVISMHYGVIVHEEKPMPYFFQEECARRSKKQKGKLIHWRNDGCESQCDHANFTCRMTCKHTTSFAVLQLLGESKLSERGKVAASILSIVGSVISIISLLAALVVYYFLRSKISTAQYAIHSNLMVSLLISLCIFLTLLIEPKDDVLCKFTMFSLQYFFLAAFCWMLCEGIHLYRQIITVFESGSKYIRIYFFLGWVVPFFLVIVSMVGITTQESRYPNNNCCESRSKPCFFNYEDGSIWYFLVPVLIVIVVNTAILARVTIVVVKAAKLQAEKGSSQSLYQAKAGLRSALLLVPLLGCSYTLGFLASVHGVFEILYNIVNSLQGFLLALFYCVMNKEVRGAIGQHIQRSRDISTIQASTAGTYLQKVNPDLTKRRLNRKNQVEPAEELQELSQIDDVD